jgi:DNA-binding XRE family transcriptional regulator
MERHQEPVSPVGRSAYEDAEERAQRSPAYRRLREMTAPFQEIAWQLIKYRMDHGLTQEDLAARVGTSHSQISRIESGRHATSMTTLVRIADALGLDVEVNFKQKQTGGRKRAGSRARQSAVPV